VFIFLVRNGDEMRRLALLDPDLVDIFVSHMNKGRGEEAKRTFLILVELLKIEMSDSVEIICK